jgi:hypothetical protein
MPEPQKAGGLTPLTPHLSITSPSGCACGGTKSSEVAASPLIYAVGRIRPHLADVSIERELVHAAGHTFAHGWPDSTELHEVLSRPENRYLARKMCWIFDVDGIDAFFVAPSDPTDLDLLLASLKARADKKHDFDVIVGAAAPAPVACGLIQLPVVVFDQLSTLNLSDVVAQLPLPSGVSDPEFRKDAMELLHLLLERAVRFGIGEEQRAINFLALRYHGVYDRFAKAKLAGERLVSVNVALSTLSNPRKLVDVIFGYENNAGAVEKYAVRVDITQEFPFLTNQLTAVLC